MLLDMAMNMMEKFIEEIKSVEPAKREQFIKNALILTDLGTEVMRESPELRLAFAKIHSEFLMHPECVDTIRQSFEAYKRYEVSKLI